MREVLHRKKRRTFSESRLVPSADRHNINIDARNRLCYRHDLAHKRTAQLVAWMSALRPCSRC
jgi:hypothetical protein